MRHPTAPLSIGLSLGLAIALFVTGYLALPAQSREPDKTLTLFFGHTGETGTFTFKRNGVYDQAELARMNQFLRDWRQNQATHMDPHLFDLIWSIYQQTGSHEAIHIVSAYRSPTTNEMLRARAGSGVAKNSQHRLGKAMDIFIPGVPLAQLRAIAMKMQGGGVGYYPRSGSPFVHVDTGNVRAWPRMSREQLIALFPNGNTLHLPASGPPLPGYELAVARRKSEGGTVLAYADTGASDDDADRTGPDSGTRGWLQTVFPGKGNAGAAAATSAAAAPAATQTASLQPADIDARLPNPRPATDDEALDDAEAPSTMVASAEDADAIAMLVMPALQANAAPAAGAAPAPAGPANALAAVASVARSAPAAAETYVKLGYASPETSGEAVITDADRAILAAFTTVDQSDAVQEPDPSLVAAVRTEAHGVRHPSAEPAAASGAGVVLAAAEVPGYGSDEDALVGMIGRPSPPDPQVARLAMPEPKATADLFVAPGASEVAQLGAGSPPVNRFAPKTIARAENGQGFFTKLFASLIE